MPGARLTLVVALAVASVGVAPGRAGADGPDVAVIEATAEADFTAGRYQEALRGFERLYRLQPRAETLFAIARCHQELGQCARAAEVFEDFLATDPDAAARRAAAERMASCVAAAPPPVEAPPVEAPPPGPRVRTTPSVEAAPARSRRGLVLGLAGGGVAVGLVAATLELSAAARSRTRPRPPGVATPRGATRPTIAPADITTARRLAPSSRSPRSRPPGPCGGPGRAGGPRSRSCRRARAGS
ncbi:MAG: hypothetical protein IPL61_35570 [Myxococcales bacterium]|nr:hypothetical protein [Myxococcales bacterium]